MRRLGDYERPGSHILLILLLGLIVYSNTFDVPFHNDDRSFIIQNPAITNPGTLSLCQNRSIGFLSFALNHRLHGFTVWGYHAVNLAIHLTNALLVYLLVTLLFNTALPDTKRDEDAMRWQGAIAFFSALLFVSHPLQTGAVTYIWQRVTSLATLFYLLSVVMYVMWRPGHQLTGTEEHAQRTKPLSLALYLCSLISAILAMKTKEISFTLPFVIMLYELFFRGRPGQAGALVPATKRFLYILPFLLSLIIIPLGLIGHQSGLSGHEGDVGEKIRQDQLRDIASISKHDYLLTQFRVVVTYIRLLFLPMHQNGDYDYPIYRSFLEPNVFLSSLFLLMIVLTAAFLYQRSHDVKTLRIASFGMFWFFITLTVESSVIPIRTIIAEHRMYLPSVGAFIAISSVIFYVAQFLLKHYRLVISPQISYIPAFVVVIALSVASYQRNSIWRDEITFLRDIVKKSPHKTGPHIGLGTAFHNKGLFNDAIPEYLAALEKTKSITDPYFLSYNLAIIYDNLGHSYLAAGKPKPAIPAYSKALQLTPNYYIAHNNLGLAYFASGDFDNAVLEYTSALNLKPDFAEAHYNIGRVYHKQALLDEALAKYHDALRLRPDYARAYFSIGLIYAKQEKPNEAVQAYSKAIQVKPDYAEAYNNISNAYMKLGLIDPAIDNYLMALMYKPDFVEAHYNLGEAYQQKGLISESEQEFRLALKINPGYVPARQRLGLQ